MPSFRYLALAGLLALPHAAAADDPSRLLAAAEEQVTALIEQVEPAIVSIVRGQTASDRLAGNRLDPFGAVPGRFGARWNVLPQFPHPGDPDFVPDQFGAGVIVADSQGTRFVLTNHHIVAGGPAADAPAREGASQIYVRFHDRRGFFATIHASDQRSDLAVLRIDYDAIGEQPPAAPDDFPPFLPLSDATEYRKGQFVFVFGNPYGIARDGSASVAWGMIGNILRRPAPTGTPLEPGSRADETIHHYGTLLQLDCRADLGFSGGAAVDRNGSLVGLTTALSAIEGYESTAGFAIPIDAGIRRIIGELLSGHEAEYGFLGIQPADVTAAQLRLFTGQAGEFTGAVRAETVKTGSPADHAGLKAGDLIVSIDGRKTVSTADLMRQIGLAGPGTRVELDTLRIDGRGAADRRTVRVRLDKWPVVNDADLVATVPRYEPWRGMRVDHATSRQRFLSPQLEPYPQGVVVLELDENANLPEQIKPGEFITTVNGRTVATPEEFYATVRHETTVTLGLMDGRRVTVP